MNLRLVIGMMQQQEIPMMIAWMIEMVYFFFFAVGTKLDVESKGVIKPTLSCLTSVVPAEES